MQPVIHLNHLAIVVAVLANFFFGWLWFGPLFGKAWAKEMGMNMDQKPDSKVMLRGMTLSLIGAILLVICLNFNLEVWRPSTWKLGPDQADVLYGFLSGFFTWLGFFVPQFLHGVAWANKSWKLFGLNAAHQFFALQIVSMILAFWK